MIFDFLLPFLTQYGLITLFLGSFLSTFIFFPGFSELSTVLFLSQNFDPLLIFVSLALGSILGGFAGYYFGIFGADMILRNEKGVKNVEKWIERWGNLSVFAASFFPIPFPFALFAILAGFLKMNTKSFFAAMIIGKSLRVALSISILLWGINLLKFYNIFI